MVVMTRLHLAVRGAAALSLALGALGLGSSAFGADGAAPVLIGHIDGEINPITARYVDRVVSDGESDNAAAVVFVHLLPGALIRNRGFKFRCEHVHVRVETINSPFTSAARKGQVLRLPIAHGEGCYFADEATISDDQETYQTTDGGLTWKKVTPE